MIKKTVIILGIPAVVLVILFTLASRKLPDIIIAALQQGIRKEVLLEKAKYISPLGAKIDKLTIVGEEENHNEKSFYVDSATIQVNPVSLLRGTLRISTINITHPEITIRKLRYKYYHALTSSDDGKRLTAISDKDKFTAKDASSKKRPPAKIIIDKLRIKDGFFRFIDYDIADKGFIIEAHNIDAAFSNLSNIKINKIMEYDLTSSIFQGRQFKPAGLIIHGSTDRAAYDTDANMTFDNIWIPYFAPYYRKITPSRIDSGFINLQSTTNINNLNWTTNARADVRQLVFGEYESDGSVFGFDAVSLVEVIKSKSGGLVLDLVLRWDLRDKDITFKRVLRKSIERSLKNTLMLNIQNVIDNTLEKLGNDGEGFIKNEFKDLVGNIKKMIN